MPSQPNSGHASAALASAAGAARTIVDAHQHFWNPERHYYPWLCDEPPIAFRYGQAPGRAGLSRDAPTTSCRSRTQRHWPPARRSRPRPRKQRATPTSCCSTCRPPPPSSTAVFGVDGVATRDAGRRNCVVDFSTVKVDQGRAFAAQSARAAPAAAGSTPPSPAARRRSASGTLTVMAGGDDGRHRPHRAADGRCREALHAHGPARAAGWSPR